MMRATGIVRRVDELGRTVIPKELRRSLRIREGDPLEFFTLDGGQIIIKKYSPLTSVLDEDMSLIAATLTTTVEVSVLITDMDDIIASHGPMSHRLSKGTLGKAILDVLHTEEACNPVIMSKVNIKNKDLHLATITEAYPKIGSQCIVPIKESLHPDSAICGTIAIFSENQQLLPEQVTAAIFAGALLSAKTAQVL